MRFSFGAEERPLKKVLKQNDKRLERKYFKLANYIFIDFGKKLYFDQNIEFLRMYLAGFREWKTEYKQPILELEIVINPHTKHLLTVPNK